MVFRIAASAALLFWSVVAAEAAPDCTVTRVTDGDTLHMTCDGIRHKVRLLGMDTPEIYHPKCEAERQMGLKATRLMKRLVAAGPVTGVEFDGHDRYGRDLARVEIAGQDLTEAMLRAGLAVVYVPRHKQNWCR